MARNHPHSRSAAITRRRVPFGDRAEAGFVTPVGLRPPLRHEPGNNRLILIDAPMRIASPEMLSGTEVLPHLICSPPVGGGDDFDEAGEYGSAR